MKVVKIFLVLLFLVSTSIFFVNCSDEQNEVQTGNAKVSEVTFAIPKNNASYRNGETDTEDYLNYVYFDGIPANQFIAENNIDKTSFINLIDNKMESFETDVNSSENSLMARKKPSLEEIRDAMINECENAYCCGLDEACVLAVKIAYHIKKSQQ